MHERARALAAPLRDPVFRRFWAAGLLSEVGDWAARFALAVLVYAESGSASLTGAVTAVSLAAWLGPGQLLTALTDRFERRTVLVVGDVVRAGAFGLAACGVPLWLLLAVVFVAGLATPPAESAAAAVRPSLVPPAQLPAAHAVSGIAQDLALLLGSLAGGGLVAALGTTGALWFNAGTFLASAWLVRCVPLRDAASEGDDSGSGARLRAAVLVVRDTPAVRRAAVMGCTAMGSASAGTAMLAPYVLGELRGDAASVAWLTAVAAAVTVVATAVAVPHRADLALQLRSIALLSLLGGAALAVLVVSPTLPLLLLPLAGLGLLQVVMVPASAAVGPLLPDELRGSAFSLLAGGLTAAQALGAVGAGLLADLAGVPVAVALAAAPAVAVGVWHLLRPLPVDEPARAVVIVLPDAGSSTETGTATATATATAGPARTAETVDA